MTTLLLIRHAATDLVDKALAGWTPGVHLNEEGKRQAERLAERLAHARIAAIYCSPLERAWETAAPLALRLGVEVQARGEIGEIDFGDWNGRALEELADELRWRLFNLYRSGTRIPNGELMLEAQARAIAMIERLREAHPRDVIALVSHGDIIRAALAFYMGIHLDLFQRIEISPASVSIITLNDHGPQVLSVNDTGRLPDSVTASE